MRALICVAMAAVSLLPVSVARADLVGVVSLEKEDDKSQSENLFIVNLYAVFDDPTDRLLSVGFGFIVADDPTNGYFQHESGGDTSPDPDLFDMHPLLRYDTFVTVGLKENVDGLDATAVDPDFDMEPSPGLLLGGWFNSFPPNDQGEPGAHGPAGHVLLAQLTVDLDSPTPATSIGGDFTVFWKDGDSGEVKPEKQEFVAPVPGPGGLVLLAAGLASCRRRR